MMDEQTVKKVSKYYFDIRWGDCDAAGITYYAKYFDWFSDGRINFMKQVGLPYGKFFHDAGIVLVVLEANCLYKKSLRLEQPVCLETSLVELSRTRLTFGYRVLMTDGTVVAEGHTSHAFVDFESKPFDVKKRYPELWKQLNEALSDEGKDIL